MSGGITWLGHDAFRFEGEAVLYTDPFMLEGGHGTMIADIILITHAHNDHCSPEDIAKVADEDTVIVATPDCAEKLDVKPDNLRTVKPGDTLEVKGVKVEAVASYNTNKKFHPKDNNWVGFIFTIGGKRIYHAGDTDRIPEMKGIKCDIALLPVSGTYVMTAKEAVQAALDIKPGLAIPMHYGGPVIGTIEDAKRFAKGLKGKVDVKILEQSRRI
ncbi:MAG: MBL fold metallo-hydrolase [Thermodesulfovibrionales bacterium]|nr:MBL fold metallo-hydrolase [Thermodesulfovibrionales bacterium]